MVFLQMNDMTCVDATLSGTSGTLDGSASSCPNQISIV